MKRHDRYITQCLLYEGNFSRPIGAASWILNLDAADKQNPTGCVTPPGRDALPRGFDALVTRFPETLAVLSNSSQRPTSDSHPPENPIRSKSISEDRALPHAVPGPTSRTVTTTKQRATNPDGRSIHAQLTMAESSPPSELESMYRLLSETAHDLRAPLTTIRESVRLVRDGELGNVNTEQSEFLSAAINQCNCVAHLIDEMMQSRRFDSGFPNVKREWMSVDQVRESVDQTLQPWTLPRGIKLLWDGPFGQGIQLYADANLLRRLIVNLAGNAIRVTREGGSVLVRAETNERRGELVWSVVDQGRGIVPSDLELIASGKAPAKSVGGLGLMISRQLAAAHFSSLQIESRVGTGTAASFRTTIGGPTSVVGHWVRWRSDLCNAGDRQIEGGKANVHVLPPTSKSGDNSSPRLVRRVRIDDPTRMIELGLMNEKPSFPLDAYLTTVTVGAAVPATAIDAFDRLLQQSMRVSELAYRTGRRSWVIAWDADQNTGRRKQDEFEQIVGSELDSMRMTWGQPSLIAASDQTQFADLLSTKLTELLVRQSLMAAQQSVHDIDRANFPDMSSGARTLAEFRLDRDTYWLADRRAITI